MNRMKTHIALCFMALILIYGCKTTPKNSVDNNIAFDSVSVEKVYHILDNPANPNCNLQLNFIYPVKMDNKELLDKAQRQFVADFFGDDYESLSPQDAIAKYTETYIEAYKELEDDFKIEQERSKGDPVMPWFSYYEMSENNIEYNSNNILSYSVSFSNYTGGAHGSHSTKYHVIDLETGKAVTEEDIFIEDFQEQLARILVDKIAELNDVKDPKELEQIGFFSVDEIFPNNNFLINKTGITYAFNEYEIAAYVVGLIDVHVSYQEITHLLRKESPIAHLAF